MPDFGQLSLVYNNVTVVNFRKFEIMKQDIKILNPIL